ncbi:MAG TPA: methyltransferase domain-containing protein [Deltaproteobacteria bacterium]|nr:methyltransferase domain-containing protein [Deltaproteobacteria bacterium]
MATSRTIEEQFGPVAAEYAAFDYHASGPDLAVLLEAARMSGRERVLDVGSGPGNTALLLAPQASRVVALDPTGPMLAEGRRRAIERGLDNVGFERGMAEDLPFPEDHFDRVTSRQSAHHYADVQAAMREIARVLTADGRFLLIDSVSPEDDEFDAFLDRIERLRDPTHVRNHRVSEWRAFFDDVGFDFEERAMWTLRLDFDAWVARSRTSLDAVASLRACFREASARARERFDVDRHGNWSLPISLMVGTPRR